MSMQMNLDEMIECLTGFDPSRGARFQAVLEGIGSEMAAIIGDRFDCNAGPATFEGVAFAGTTASFRPRYAGQPFPSDDWAAFDDGGRGAWEFDAEQPDLPRQPELVGVNLKLSLKACRALHDCAAVGVEGLESSMAVQQEVITAIDVIGRSSCAPGQRLGPSAASRD